MFKRTVLVLVVLAALIAPASAGATTTFLIPPPPQPRTVAATSAAVPAATDSSAVTADPSGFDWGDAALGAATALVLVGVGGGLIWMSRRPTPGSPA